MDQARFAEHWYVLFPILGFVVAFFSITLHHRRSRAMIDVLKAYAQAGKEPPASLRDAIRD